MKGRAVAVWLVAAGCLWSSEIARGLAQVGDSTLSRQEPRPQVAIESVRVNRRAVDAAAVDLPRGAGELEVSYTGLSFPDPDRLGFQYRLDTFDVDWVDAGTRRTAFYTNLPAGRYTFRVRAITADGAVSATEAVVPIVLQPRFHQTWLFAGLSAAGVGLLLVLAYRWRLRVLRSLQSDLMRLVRERTEQLEQANRTLALMSYVDALTETANRRAFEDALATEGRRSTRARTPLSLLMVDIDGFKELNDTLGHQAGDTCLREIARAITDSVGRPADRVSRYGGDEFAVLLPDTAKAGAAALAERIRAAVERMELQHPESAQGRVTVSVGVATMVGGEETGPAGLVEAADQALYEAKRSGRNRVGIAPPH
jgi:diguanylate cyclase (GGDEF)-like protein